MTISSVYTTACSCAHDIESMRNPLKAETTASMVMAADQNGAHCNSKRESRHDRDCLLDAADPWMTPIVLHQRVSFAPHAR